MLCRGCWDEGGGAPGFSSFFIFYDKKAKTIIPNLTVYEFMKFKDPSTQRCEWLSIKIGTTINKWYQEKSKSCWGCLDEGGGSPSQPWWNSTTGWRVNARPCWPQLYNQRLRNLNPHSFNILWMRNSDIFGNVNMLERLKNYQYRYQKM